MSSYRESMRELHKAHQEFKKEWNNCSKNKLEPELLIIARNKFWDALQFLFETQLKPLEIAFLENPFSVADDVIEFLSVDITAHRCGYVKEWFLTKLKSVELTTAQKMKLQQIALSLCESYNFRREINYWSRLMIKLADRDFVNKLHILSNSSNRYAQIKAKWLLDKILYHRKDLAINSLES